MLSESEVVLLFADQTVQRFDEVYFPKEVAAEFVDTCEGNDLAVIGVEAFFLEAASVRPLPDLIADYSVRAGKRWADYRALCNMSASRFVERLPSCLGLVATFTVQSADE